MIQTVILIASGLSILLFSSKGHYKYGFLAGLAAQPFWLYASYQAKQWGIFVLSVWFTICYIRGIKNHFGKGE
jgi:hypothetical protein